MHGARSRRRVSRTHVPEAARGDDVQHRGTRGSPARAITSKRSRKSINASTSPTSSASTRRIAAPGRRASTITSTSSQRLTGMSGAFGRSYTLRRRRLRQCRAHARRRSSQADVHELPGTGEPRTLLENVDPHQRRRRSSSTSRTPRRGAALNASRARQAARSASTRTSAASAHPFIARRRPQRAAGRRGGGEASSTTNVVQLAGDPKTPTHRVHGAAPRLHPRRSGLDRRAARASSTTVRPITAP